jgi:hypothetical protein
MFSVVPSSLVLDKRSSTRSLLVDLPLQTGPQIYKKSKFESPFEIDYAKQQRAVDDDDKVIENRCIGR